MDVTFSAPVERRVIDNFRAEYFRKVCHVT
jgi:hypothetical protein